MNGRDRIMFKQMQPHLIRLQRTNGLKPITVCYGEAPIELGSMPFYNYKNRHTYAGDTTNTYYTDFVKNIKMTATVHVIKMHTKDWYPDYSGALVNNLPNIFITDRIGENNIQGKDAAPATTSATTGVEIPNFNDVQMATNFISFINNLKSKKLNQLLTKIYYYVTHGDTPYSNVDYQNDYKTFNSFISVTPTSDYLIYYDAVENLTLNTPAPTGNNYPQCALLSEPVDTPINMLPFTNTNPYSWIAHDVNFPTFPSLGIYFGGTDNDYQDYTHIYWTTYKGL